MQNLDRAEVKVREDYLERLREYGETFPFPVVPGMCIVGSQVWTRTVETDIVPNDTDIMCSDPGFVAKYSNYIVERWPGTTVVLANANRSKLNVPGIGDVDIFCPDPEQQLYVFEALLGFPEVYQRVALDGTTGCVFRLIKKANMTPLRSYTPGGEFLSEDEKDDLLGSLK